MLLCRRLTFVIAAVCIVAFLWKGQTEAGPNASPAGRRYVSARADSQEVRELRNAALGLIANGDRDGAVAILKEAIAGKDSHPDVKVLAHLYLGGLLAEEGRFEGSISALEECRLLARADRERYELFDGLALSAIGSAQFRMGRYDDSMSSYKSLIEGFPGPLEGTADIVGHSLHWVQECYKAKGEPRGYWDYCKDLAQKYPGRLSGGHAALQLGIREAEEAKTHSELAVNYLKSVVRTFGEGSELAYRARSVLRQELRAGLGLSKVGETCALCGRRIGGDWKYVVTLKDETSKAFCGPRHGIQYELQVGRDVVSAQVLDFTTSELTDAKGATYIIPEGGAGTLIAACSSRDEAERLVAEEGGRALSYEELSREIKTKLPRNKASLNISGGEVAMPSARPPGNPAPQSTSCCGSDASIEGGSARTDSCGCGGASAEDVILPERGANSAQGPQDQEWKSAVRAARKREASEDYTGALEELLPVLKLAGKLPAVMEVVRDAGRILGKQGEPAAAAEYISGILEEDPANPAGRKLIWLTPEGFLTDELPIRESYFAEVRQRLKVTDVGPELLMLSGVTFMRHDKRRARGYFRQAAKAARQDGLRSYALLFMAYYCEEGDRRLKGLKKVWALYPESEAGEFACSEAARELGKVSLSATLEWVEGALRSDKLNPAEAQRLTAVAVLGLKREGHEMAQIQHGFKSLAEKFAANPAIHAALIAGSEAKGTCGGSSNCGSSASSGTAVSDKSTQGKGCGCGAVPSEADAASASKTAGSCCEE